MSSHREKAANVREAQGKSSKSGPQAKHSWGPVKIPSENEYYFKLGDDVHKKWELERQRKDSKICVPVYKIADRSHVGESHMEQYLLEPVWEQHGYAEMLARSAIEAVQYPECYDHTHCGETAQKTGQQAQKVSSSSGGGGNGSKGAEGRIGGPASNYKSKAPMAPRDSYQCPRYSYGDHPPPYDALMMQQSYQIPLHDSVGAHEKTLDMEDAGNDENTPEKDTQDLRNGI